MTFMALDQDDVPPVVEAIYARGQSVVGVNRTDDGRVELTVSPQPALSVLWVPLAAHPSTAVGVVPLPPGLLTMAAPPGGLRHQPLLATAEPEVRDASEGRA